MNPACDLVDVGVKAFHDGAKDLESFAKAMKKQFGRDLPPDVLDAAFKKAAERFRARSSEVEAIKMQLAQELGKSRHSGLLETVTGLRRAGLLTGIRTQVRNIAGNTLGMAFDEVARIPGALADMALGKITGRRTMLMPDAQAIGKATISAVTKGLKNSAEVMRHGTTAEELAKYDIPRELNAYFKGVELKPINGYVNFVNRLQSAADKPFREFAFVRSLLEQGKIQAKAERLTGQAFKRRVEQVVSSPTDAMRLRAIADSEEAVFGNSNKLSRGLSALGRQGGSVGTFAMDTLVPFKQVPTNVGGRVLESTPLGGLKIAGLIKNVKDPAVQREIAKTFGRSTTGSGMLVLGYQLAKQGVITGEYSRDAGTKGRNEAAGRTESSVKMPDGRYYKLGDSPPGHLLSIGAGMYHSQQEGKHPPNAGLAAVKETGKTLLDMPMLQGASDLVDTVKSPETEGGKFLKGLAGSTVPTLVGDLAAQPDAYQRDVKTPLDAIKNRIPGMRQSLPVKHDALGAPIKRTSLVNPYEGAASKEGDKTIKELVRLKVPVQPPQMVKDEAKKGVDRTSAEYQQKVEIVGKAVKSALDKVVSHQSYGRFSDEVRRDLLADVQKRVRGELSKALNQGITRERLSQLSEKVVAHVLGSYTDKSAVFRKH